MDSQPTGRMPDLEGRTIGDARRYLRERNPDVVIAADGPDDATIVRQYPPKGARNRGPIGLFSTPTGDEDQIRELVERSVARAGKSLDVTVDSQKAGSGPAPAVPDLTTIDPPTVAHACFVLGFQNIELGIACTGGGSRPPETGDGNKIITAVRPSIPEIGPGSRVEVEVGDPMLPMMPNLHGRDIDEARELLRDRCKDLDIRTTELVPGSRIVVGHNLRANEPIVCDARPRKSESRVELMTGEPATPCVEVPDFADDAEFPDVQAAYDWAKGKDLKLVVAYDPFSACHPPTTAELEEDPTGNHVMSLVGSCIPVGGTVGLVLRPPIPDESKAFLLGLAIGVVVGVVVTLLLV